MKEKAHFVEKFSFIQKQFKDPTLYLGNVLGMYGAFVIIMSYLNGCALNASHVSMGHVL